MTSLLRVAPLLALALLPSASLAQNAAVRGDVDGDGQVTVADARAVLDYVAGRAVPAGRRLLPNGDADGNGRITAVDAAIINAFAAGRDMSRYPVGRAIDAAQTSQLAALECQASVAARTVACRPSGGDPGRGARGDVLVGGQNLYVTLANGPVSIVADSFIVDVTVKNLVPQPMGLDSLGAVDPNGVRVIFANGPNVTAGTGTASVANEDGTGTFTASNQPYFTYSNGTGLLGGDGKLAQNETSGTRTWKIQFDPTVTAFNFMVYVSAPFQYPNGWIDLYPRSIPIGPTQVPVDTLLVGDTQQLVDSVRNAVGKVVPGQPVTWASTGPAISVNGSGLVTAAAVGADSIVATASGGLRKGRYFFQVTDLAIDSTAIDVLDGTLTAGDSTLVTVQLKDGFGRPYPNAATVVVTKDHGVLSPVQNLGGGTYTSYIKWDSVGTVTLSATVNGTPIADSTTVTFSAGSPVNLNKLSTDPQTATVNTAVASPPSVSVTDGLSNPVSGATVRFRVLSGGGKVNTADSVDIVTGGSGVATLTSWTMGTVAGTANDSLVVTVVGTAVTPANFVASATPGAAANMVKSAGDAQSATVNTNVATAPAVTITDGFGNPVPGVSVTFTPSAGGSVTGSPAATNASGVATVGSWKLKTASGANSLDASSAGLTTVTFSATGTPDAPATLTKTSTDPQNGTVGNAVGSPPAVNVKDQYGNNVPSVTITFAVTGGGGSVTGGTPSTDGSGNAAVGSWTLGGTGLNTLQASASPAGTTTPVTFTAHVPPVANTDSSQAMGNTTIATPTAPNVLTNDVSPDGGTLTVTTTGALATARSGTVTMAANGTYSYLPPAGNVLRDSVQYTINDGNGSASAYLKFRFVGKVWYVDNTFGGTATGRDVSPFPSISAAEAAAPGPAVNDSILVRTGSGTTTGGTLKNGQLVYGQGASSSFTTTLNSQSVTLLAAGSPPSIGAITLGSGNTLRGFTGVGTLTGSGFGTLTVSEMALATGATQALSLTTGTLSGGFTALTSSGGTNNVLLSGVATSGTSTLGASGNALSGASGDGVVVSGGGGSFTFPGNVSNATSFAVNVNGKTGGTVTFSGNVNPSAAGRGISVTGNSSGTNTIVFSGGTQSISSAAANGVFLNNNTGAAITFSGGGLTIATTTGTPFTATGGGTVEVTGAGNTISATGNAANVVNLSGITLGAGGMAFASINSSGTPTGSAFTATSVGNTSGSTFTAGSLTVSGTTGASSRGLALTTSSAPFTFTTATINNTGGEGIYLNGNTAAVNVSGGNVGNTTSTTGDALAVTGGNAGVAVAAALSKSTAGRIANIISHTAGTVTVSGNLSCTGSCTGVNVASNSGGGIAFTAGTKTLTTGANAAATLSSNTGATIDFTGGGLAITTTSGAGINATGGGTVTVTGSNNTISSGTGTALTVSSTTIGASGLTFRSISASGGANGIMLSSTGSGGLTVTGDGSTNGSGGTITNMTGSDGATSGTGVYLSSAQKISLSWMALSGHANHGIFGTGVRGGFTLDHVRLTGNNGTSNSGTFNESALRLDNVGGPVKLTGSRFDGGAMNAVRVDNSIGTNPTVDSLVFENDTVSTMQGSTADVRGSALLVSLMDGTADVRFRTTRVLSWWSSGIHVLSQGTASATARVTNNFVDNTNGALAGASGIVVAGCRLAFNISSNTVRHTNGVGIATDMNPGCTQTLQGTIDNNSIGVSGDAASGSATGIAIAAGARAGTTTVKISNNIIRQVAGSASGAITTTTGDAAAYGGSGTMNATISGNNIQESAAPVNNAQHGILITHGTSSSAPGDAHQGCYDVLSNTVINFTSGTANNRLRVNQRFSTTSRFPSYTGAATGVTSQTDLAAYLLGRNTASTSTNANTSTGGFLNTAPAGSACPQPSM